MKLSCDVASDWRLLELWSRRWAMRPWWVGIGEDMVKELMLLRCVLHDHRVACMNCGHRMLWTFDYHGHERPASIIAFVWHDFVIERKWTVIVLIDGGDRFDPLKRTSHARLRQRERKNMVTNLIWAHNLSSKLIEMDRLSLLIEVEEGLGRQSAVAEAILWAEQETEIIMFVISCLLLANYKSLQL
jgi:hypothetical protein